MRVGLSAGEHRTICVIDGIFHVTNPTARMSWAPCQKAGLTNSCLKLEFKPERWLSNSEMSNTEFLVSEDALRVGLFNLCAYVVLKLQNTIY